jgi:hypothetical protein
MKAEDGWWREMHEKIFEREVKFWFLIKLSRIKERIKVVRKRI